MSTSASVLARGLPRWVWLIGLGVILALGLVVFFFLMQATDRWESYANYLPLLFALNLAVALVLVIAILPFHLGSARSSQLLGASFALTVLVL